MANFHVNRWGRIVRCYVPFRKCGMVTHLTKSEATFITNKKNYDANLLTDEWVQLYINHINYDSERKDFKAENSRHFFDSRDDYNDGSMVPKKYDPFSLNSYSSARIEDELAADRDGPPIRHMNSEDDVFFTIRAMYDGKHKPRKAHSYGLVFYYFKTRRHVVVPAGTVIRHGSPGKNFENTVAAKDMKCRVLNVNNGSCALPSLGIAGVPVTLTWVGLDGFLRNIDVNQEVLDAN